VPATTTSVKTTSETAHRAAVERLLASYRAIPQDATVRLAKKTSNLFRARAATGTPGLDVCGLTGVISIDPQARTADVAGMTTYEDLVAATLPHGLAPLVVPQLRTITLGGAVTGLGIESSSFRNGLPHESVLELDVLTGGGEIVTARPTGDHADLFRGFPNSYGTLGYATRLRIELEQVPRYVALRHLRFDTLVELQDALARIVDAGSHDGEPVDYLDGVVFSPGESYLSLGRKTDESGPVGDYTGMDVYYRSIQAKRTDRLTIHDYLWRWDTDWFWCSRAFGAQNPRIRRLWPKRYLRSDVYWKLVALDRRFGIGDRIEARSFFPKADNPPRERVVQDVEVPVDRAADYLTWFFAEIPIEPVWLCPVRLKPPAGLDDPSPWSLYPIERDRTYVNVGFWSAVPSVPGQPSAANRSIEAKVGELGGHKSLYSDAFYDRMEFDRLYGGSFYADLKRRYDPRHRLLDLYAKAVQQQ
jgi:FAD/FMN-containing dehydrogenase